MKNLAIMFGLVFTFAGAASAQNTGGIDNREGNQKERIVNGVKSGELGPLETAKLLKQQLEIRKHERAGKSDGVVTLRERVRLHRELNQAGKNIKRKKNN